MAVSSGPAQYLPFIHCLEQYGPQQKAKVAKCATEVKLPLNALNTCWQGPQGKALIAKAAKETPADHTYVPWSTANGVNYCDVSLPAPLRRAHWAVSPLLIPPPPLFPNTREQENGCDGGLAAVCKAYVASGGTAPAGCPAASLRGSAGSAAAAGSSCPRDW